ncbi:hypothetical protein F4677DRAFT_464215 [Hypoxylon crocopeplum]|nr:hypothetical protein F4677DRAFT_464215 [Hypoxylon crocopeplum]
MTNTVGILYEDMLSAFPTCFSCLLLSLDPDSASIARALLKSTLQQTLRITIEETYQDLPLKPNHELLWAYIRYGSMLEIPANATDKIPETNVPGTTKGHLVPFMIEAPLNSIKVLEAILARLAHPNLYSVVT